MSFHHNFTASFRNLVIHQSTTTLGKHDNGCIPVLKVFQSHINSLKTKSLHKGLIHLSHGPLDYDMSSSNLPVSMRDFSIMWYFINIFYTTIKQRYQTKLPKKQSYRAGNSSASISSNLHTHTDFCSYLQICC